MSLHCDRPSRAFCGEAKLNMVKQPRMRLRLLMVRLSLVPFQKTPKKIRIVWTIRNSAQKESAIFKKQNKISKGRLYRPWASLTFDIVIAVRGQILEAMRRLKASRKQDPLCSTKPRIGFFRIILIGPLRSRLQDVRPLL